MRYFNQAIQVWVGVPEAVRDALAIYLMGKPIDQFYDGEWQYFLRLIRLPGDVLYRVAKSRNCRLSKETVTEIDQWIEAIAEGLTINISKIGLGPECTDKNARAIAIAGKWLDAYLNG